MTGTEALWIVPISMIPGLGLLVLSTSARYMTVALQLRELKNDQEPDIWLSNLIFKRACCLQQALLGLYGAIAFLISASLLLATTRESSSMGAISTTVMWAGGAAALYSVLHLAYEIFTSRRIIARDHCNLQQKQNTLAPKGVYDESI